METPPSVGTSLAMLGFNDVPSIVTVSVLPIYYFIFSISHLYN